MTPPAQAVPCDTAEVGKVVFTLFLKAPHNLCHWKGVGCLIAFPPLLFLEREASSRQALWTRTMSQEGWAHRLPLPGVPGELGQVTAL